MEEALYRLIDLVIEAEGGSKYHKNAGEATGTKYGIYGFANGLTDEQVRSLTYQEAVQIYVNKYVSPQVIAYIEAKDYVNASMVFNMIVNIGPTGAKRVIESSEATKESLGESLIRYYKNLRNSDLYFYGWCIRVARNYEMGLKLLKEFN
jgi:lysozyme family protein